MGVHIQPSPMPYQASKEGGRSRHGRTPRNDIAAPAAVVQPQRRQRHAEPLARTSEWRCRAQAPRCRCARATRHRRPPSGGQDPPPGSRLERPARTRRSSFRAARTGAGPPARRSARGSPAARHASRSPRRPCRGSPARSGRSRSGPRGRVRGRRGWRRWRHWPISRGSSVPVRVPWGCGRRPRPRRIGPGSGARARGRGARRPTSATGSLTGSSGVCFRRLPGRP